MSKLEQLKKKTDGEKLLGAIVYWSFSDVDIPAEELREALQDFGIDFKIPDVTNRRALTKALTQFKKETGLHVDKITDEDDEDIAVYVISEHEVDRKEYTYRLDNVNAVIYDRGAKELSFKRRGDNISAEVEELFESLQGSYNAEDIRRLTKRFLKQNLMAVSLRERGGVYFVPACYLDELERFVDMVERTFTSSFVASLGIVDTDKTKVSVARDFKRDMMAEIDSAATELIKLLNDNEQIRASSLEKRLKRYRFMRDKVGMYVDLLQSDTTKIKSKLSRLEEHVNELLRG